MHLDYLTSSKMKINLWSTRLFAYTYIYGLSICVKTAISDHHRETAQLKHEFCGQKEWMHYKIWPASCRVGIAVVDGSVKQVTSRIRDVFGLCPIPGPDIKLKELITWQIHTPQEQIATSYEQLKKIGDWDMGRCCRSQLNVSDLSQLEITVAIADAIGLIK